MAAGGAAAAAGAHTPIPKRIHQIWLGTNPQPTEWMDTVRDFAAEYGYEYMLWTEKNVDELAWDSVPGLRRLYASFRKELAGRADVIRMLFLYQYGGIYIDADSVILKPKKFFEFLEKNRAAVFFGWEDISAERLKKLGDLGPELRGTKRLIANGTIGAVAGHPFLRLLMDGATANAEREAGEHAWRRVGPLYVTRTYMKVRDKFPDVKIYPMKLFYPRHWGGIKDPELHKKVRVPSESMLFQYGYSTNSFDKIFRERALRQRQRRLRAHRHQTRRQRPAGTTRRKRATH
jgi:hypothetical protein